MKRRDFLKKLGIAYGIAVACPGKLLKGKPVITGIDYNKPVKWYAGERSKHIFFMGQQLYYNRRLSGYIVTKE